MPLINCEVELNLKGLGNCVLRKEDDHISGVGYIITSPKLYVLVVTLSVNNNMKILENIKHKF